MTGWQKNIIVSLVIIVTVVFITLGYLTISEANRVSASVPTPIIIVTYELVTLPTSTPTVKTVPVIKDEIKTPTPSNTVIIPTATSPPIPTETAAPVHIIPATIYDKPIAPQRMPEPVWLRIPDIAVDAPIIPVGLEPSGIMESPREAHVVGWYKLGSRPGESSNAVLAGHLNWWGKDGAFARINELQPGNVIEVKDATETVHRYVVESSQTYQEETAPVAEIFGDTPNAVLTLITCAGPYDRENDHYRDRLIVRARGDG